jgi:hypothetical protein
MVPGFMKLSQDDQIVLLKTGKSLILNFHLENDLMNNVIREL